MKPFQIGLPVLCAALALQSSAALAAVPPEVETIEWCAGQKDCLGWTPVTGATSYTVYRGDVAGLPGVTSEAIDSCTLGGFTGTTAGGIDDPAPGGLHWYVVSAANLDGEGPAGESTSGTRIIDSAGPCAAPGGLVINEIDYDQPGTDFDEFVEIRNNGPVDRDLSGVVLIFVNGLSSFEYERVELSDAAAVLPAGGYLVVGTPAVVSNLPPGVPSTTLPGSSNNIQNGAPDGVALFDTTAVALLDALSYEGSIGAAQLDGIPGSFDLVEGTPTTAADSNSTPGSLARHPDGSDTNDAAVDWQFSGSPSPGLPNPAP